MNEENDNVYFSILNENTSSLTEHEKYVFDCFFKGITFDNAVFREKIKKDAIKLGLIEEGRRKINFLRNLFISMSSFLVLGIISSNLPEQGLLTNIIYALQMIAGCSIFAVFANSIYLLSKYQNENYHRTYKGNKEAKKWSSFKNFLHDYTLISDKDLNYTVILENYIPYAISLEETKSIEKYIANNKLYRAYLYKQNY